MNREEMTAEMRARFRIDELNRIVNPPMILGPGYFILGTCGPWGVAEWRPLGDKRDRLAALAAAEKRIKEAP